MRTLLLAEHCNPDWPSLPVVGYKFAKAMSEHSDVVVATQIRNKPSIERAGLGNAKVVYIDTEKIAAPLHKLAHRLRGKTDKAWTLQIAMDYPSCLAFEWKVWQHFKQELRSGAFDIVHRVTPMSPTQPSVMASLSPVPFVLGPLNGNLKWPAAFNAEMLREREWLSKLRGAYKFLPFHRSTFRNAAVILAAFDHTIADLPPDALGKTINFPEVGIDPELFSGKRAPKSPGDKMTILYAGRLVPYKLSEVVVRAFAQNPALRRHKLLMVGDGPERPRLEAIIRENGLEDCVELLGKKTQAEVGQLMQQSDIFAFPSIRELGAGVVVEAMACAMACVVVDYGGPATLIGGDRGVRVPLGPLNQLVQRFSHEIEILANNPVAAHKLGQAAQHHALAHYSWEAKAKKTLEIYDWARDKQSVQPDFWRSIAVERRKNLRLSPLPV
jgi:glycosyltransferase involved in cell wall biosynthesis